MLSFAQSMGFMTRLNIYYNQALLIDSLPVEDSGGYADPLLGLWQ